MCATHPRYGRYPTVMHEGEAPDPNQCGRVSPLVLWAVHWNEQASRTIPLCLQTSDYSKMRRMERRIDPCYVNAKEHHFQRLLVVGQGGWSGAERMVTCHPRRNACMISPLYRLCGARASGGRILGPRRPSRGHTTCVVMPVLGENGAG